MRNLRLKDVAFWDRSAAKYEASRVQDEVGYARTINAIRAQLRPGDSVLEVGCGTGSVAIRLFNSVDKIVATDISAEMIAIARGKAERRRADGIEFKICGAAEICDEDERFDVAIALNVLHLVPSLELTLAAIFEQLKPGGLFISKTPCLSLMSPFVRWSIPILQALRKAPYIRVLSPQDLKSAFIAAGFEIELQAWHASRLPDYRPFFIVRRVDGDASFSSDHHVKDNDQHLHIRRIADTGEF